MAKNKPEGYLTAKESRKISRENRRITNQFEKERKRKNVPESEYVTTMHDPDNAVEFDNLHTYFFTDAGTVKSVDGVTFEVPVGKTVGVVGESGCGKSTLAKMLVGLLSKSSGEIFYKDRSIEAFFYNPSVLQMIFQDPFSSLNPRRKVGKTIGEALAVNQKSLSRQEVQRAVEDILQEVGLEKEYYHRYPHEFSGGQRQRIAIARAIITHPEILVCDEAVSALDASHQAQVLNLLLDLKEKYSLSYLFISHNLQVISFMCDEILVMYAGEIVEQAPRAVLFENPLHPYTKALIASAPYIGKEKQDIVLQGEMPGLMQRQQGCSFAVRCPYAKPLCQSEKPRLMGDNEHKIACHFFQKEK